MKTKFIKVPVSERLPNKSGRYHTSMGRIWFFEDKRKWQFAGVEYWLEEVPDYQDEIVDVLKYMLENGFCVDKFDEDLTEKVSELLNKITKHIKYLNYGRIKI